MNGRPEVNLCLQKCVWKHTNQGKNYPNQEIKAVEETRNINVDFLFFFLQRLIERFKSVQNFIFNIWGSREGELAKSHILHSNELIQVLKWQNYGEEASKQCQISQLWQLWLSRHLSLPIPFAVLSPRLPSSPTHSAPTGPRLFFYDQTRWLNTSNYI